MSYQNFIPQFNKPKINEIRIPPSLEEPEYSLEEKYGEDKLILMVQDPRCIYAYWELTDEFYKTNNLKDKQLFLRYIDKSHNNYLHDIDLVDGCNNYFIGLEYADSIYQVYIGAYPKDNPKAKKLLMFSNNVRTQRDYSSVDHEKIDEFYNKLRAYEDDGDNFKADEEECKSTEGNGIDVNIDIDMDMDMDERKKSHVNNDKMENDTDIILRIIGDKEEITGEFLHYMNNINGQVMFVRPIDVLNSTKEIKIEYKGIDSIRTIDSVKIVQDEKGENKDESRIFNACTAPSPALCKTSGI